MNLASARSSAQVLMDDLFQLQAELLYEVESQPSARNQFEEVYPIPAKVQLQETVHRAKARPLKPKFFSAELKFGHPRLPQG
ncbi:hypothetical protein A9995_09090 [Erythrobacter sp. QSSC1-22B]|nr:hypothetical protein A9995_09090 [Erythrobacter sp. QSSC1-22B]